MIIFSDTPTNLKEARLRANISQKEMAALLNVSQSQVSRYEENPDDISMKIMRQWLEICGMVERKVEPLDLGSPYEFLKKRQQSIQQQLINFPVVDNPDITDKLDISSLVQNIQKLGRKPRMGVFGHFDMGKSRLCNVLLGNNYLPTSYQPTTSVACILRHISDKPSWQIEDVWMMGKNFNIHLIDDENHCQENRIRAGNLASLKDYATHQDDNQSDDSYYAIIYINAPILLTCDIVDMPGYEHDDKDLQRTDLASNFVDIILYLSSASGFLGKNDLDYLGHLINLLPVYEGENINPLDNLFIIATRADTIDYYDIETILNKAPKRAYKHLDLRLESKYGENKITESDLASRFFSFSADKNSLRAEFIKKLSLLLGEQLPYIISTNFEKSFQNSITSLTKTYESLAINFDNIINERQKMIDDLAELKKNENTNAEIREKKQKSITKNIPKYQKECVEQAQAIIAETLTVEYVEDMIRKRYQDKKEAKEYAASYLSDIIQTKINQLIKQKSNALSQEIDELLDEYNKVQNLNEHVHLDFNSSKAFVGAVASLTTFGALATWAAIATAGSNLGAYLLVPTVVSWLSGIGISISGGTAGAVSLVAALGGPITLGIGLAVTCGALFAWLSGSWQNKMARKIVDLLKGDFAENLIQSIETYWQDTVVSFQEASKKTEQEFKNKILSLEKSIISDDEVLKQSKEYYITLAFLLKNLK